MPSQEKKVAIFVDSRKKSGGAYQELLYTIKNIKKENKHKIKFVIIAISKNLDLNLEKENFELYYFSLNPLSRYIAFLRNFSPFVRAIKKFFFFQNKFENFLNSKNIDLVYFVGPSQYSLYLEDTKFFLTVPDVSFRENLEFPEIVDKSEFLRKDYIFQKSLPRALGIITNSEIIKKRISFFYNILEERILLINHQPSASINEFNEIDTNLQKELREKFELPKNYIFYPAMYLPHKNHKTLIDALKIIKQSNNTKNLKLVCCGNDIGYLKNLKKYTKKLNLEQEITFLNFVNDEYLPYLYLDSSILIMPSLIGPTNIAPWEAFKMKKPVIYSDLEGIREVLSDSVLYINPYDAKDIANAITKIINDTTFRDKLIKKGSIKLEETEAKDDFSNFFKIIDNYRKIQKLWNFEI
jgi:glycosyltransferase involved in cell wall biosynthesis